jgi:spermidine synthase
LFFEEHRIYQVKKSILNLAFHELYQLTENDNFVDIGSGDGVVLREASKIGARAVGFEINPILVFISTLSVS